MALTRNNEDFARQSLTRGFALFSKRSGFPGRAWEPGQPGHQDILAPRLRLGCVQGASAGALLLKVTLRVTVPSHFAQIAKTYRNKKIVLTRCNSDFAC